MDPDDLTPDAPADGPTAAPPRTGDRAVDDALAAFDETRHADPATRLAAATEAHRALQARLTAPAPPPAAPGEARPGPRR